jgi:hypothetical protein
VRRKACDVVCNVLRVAPTTHGSKSNMRHDGHAIGLCYRSTEQAIIDSRACEALGVRPHVLDSRGGLTAVP